MQEAAKSNLKRVTLELGGKSPCIVFEDSQVDEAVELAHHAIFFNQGQCCAAGSRTFVQDAIFDEFVRKAIARAKSRITGNPFHQGTEHGPQVSKMQHEKVLSMIKEVFDRWFHVKNGLTMWNFHRLGRKSRGQVDVWWKAMGKQGVFRGTNRFGLWPRQPMRERRDFWPGWV